MTCELEVGEYTSLNCRLDSIVGFDPIPIIGEFAQEVQLGKLAG